MAKRVALQQGQVMATDGLFAEAKEHLAGFLLLECKGIKRDPSQRRRRASCAA